MDFIFRTAEKFLKNHKKLMRYRRIFAVLAAVVVFATTYELILPAVTIDRQRAAETPGMEVGVAAEETVETDEEEDSGEDEAEADASVEEESRTEAEQPQEDAETESGDTESGDTESSDTQSSDTESSDAAAEESAARETVENTDIGDADQANADNGTDAAADEITESIADSKETKEASAGAAADANAVAAQEAASTATTEAAAAEYPVTLTYRGGDYTITATFDEAANLPVGVSLNALEILPGRVYRDDDGNVLYDDYDVYLEKTVDTLEKDGRLEDSCVAGARFFDISFIDPEGKYVDPAAPVMIAVQYKKALSAEDIVSTTAVRFDAGKDKTEIYETKQDVKNGAIAEISFETRKSSVYGIAAAEALKTKELTASGDTYEISLSYNQKAKIPEGAALEARELLPGTKEYEECAAKSSNLDENGETSSRFFDISIMADGAEFEPKAPVNVRITLKDTAPEEVAADKEITHFTNDGQVENIPQEVEESNDGSAEVSFRMDSFSTVEVPMLGADSSPTPRGGSVTTQEGSILDGKTFDDANEWQIVQGGYINNAPGNKTVYGTDQNVRVQKNIIPTGVENEFLVYLGVDTKVTNEIIKTFIEEKVSTGNFFFGSASHFPGGGSETYGGKTYTGTSWNSLVQGTGKNAGTHYVTFNIKYQGAVIATITLGCEDSNFQVYLKLSEAPNHVVALGLGCAKNGELIGGPDVNLTDEAYQYLIEESSKTTAVSGLSVDDPMGDYITFLGTVDGDYATVPSVDGNNVLHWNVSAKESPLTQEVSTSEIWQLNAAELLYRIRLNVTQNDFRSCAEHMGSTPGDEWSYQANKNAVLHYNTDQTAEFPDPYIRGLLYDIKVKKVDELGRALSGAKFSLTGTSNTTGVDIAQSAASALTTTQLTSDENGFVTVTGLPWGTYTLVETEAPSGYRKDDSPHIADLCYTTNRTGLSVSTESADRMMQTSWRDPLVVENKKNIITVTKTVAVKGNDIQLSDVDHTIYIALRRHGSQEYVTDASGNIRYETITITGGIPEPSSVTFEGVDTGNYDVMELQEAPASGSETVTTLAEGYRFTTSAGKKIQLAEIAGSSSNIAENGTLVQSTGNNADLRYSNESQVAFTNTYSHQTTVSKIVIKKWMHGGSEIPAPEGASVVFKLYRRVGNGTPEQVAGAEISLDGTVDGTDSTGGELTPWQATFVDLDVEDDQGNAYTYLAREVSCPDEFEPYASSSDSAPMGESDYLNLNNANTITNKRKTTSIIVKKENSEGAFIPGAKFKLFRIETDSEGETHDNLVGEEFTFSDTDSAGITIDGLPSGLYKLTETAAPAGYIITDRDIIFTVDAKGSGSVITWNGGTKPDTVKPLSQTNSTDDTITVINTPGAILPETGGTGFLSPKTLCGIMAMSFVLATAVMYGFSMRRGERRYK